MSPLGLFAARTFWDHVGAIGVDFVMTSSSQHVIVFVHVCVHVVVIGRCAPFSQEINEH